MRLTFLLALCILILIFWSVNYYIGIRGWQSIGSAVPYLSKKVYWVVFWIIAFSYLAARFGENYLPRFVNKFLLFLGGYWMACMLYFILFILVIDLFRLVDRWIGFIPRNIKQGANTPFITGLSVLFLVAAVLVYGTLNARSPKITYYDINVDKNAGGIKELNVVMASDFHLGTMINRASLVKFVDMINAQNPDLVLLPGDIIDDDLGPFVRQNMSEVFKLIKSKYGVYCALGNHDYFSGKTDELVKHFEESGIQVLQDSYMLVNDSFYVIGRKDASGQRYSGSPRKELGSILEGVDKSLPLLLMDHQPISLDEPQKQGIDLQVSGHTHRGQMFPSQFITQKIFEIDWGYLKKGMTHIIVTSGFGVWGSPIRTSGYSEIVNITIRFSGS